MASEFFSMLLEPIFTGLSGFSVSSVNLFQFGLIVIIVVGLIRIALSLLPR